MNTKNNKRRKASRDKIEIAFIHLLQKFDAEDISITELCKAAQINRSTFYANYMDIYDLVKKIEERMLSDFEALYSDEIKNKYNSNDYLRLFHHIKENQLFYQAYFKLQFDLNVNFERYDKELAKIKYDNKHIEYHMEFFRGGITSMIKMWLKEGCKLEPEELSYIIKEEYRSMELIRNHS